MAGVIVVAILLVLCVAGGVVVYRRTIGRAPYSGSMKGAFTVASILGAFLGISVGLATLLLLPCFAIGLTLTYRTLNAPRGIACLRRPSPIAQAPDVHPGLIFGRRLLLAVGAAMFTAGLTISILGMTIVFVPEDLAYMENVYSPPIGALNEPIALAAQNGLANAAAAKG